ncbi:MAG: AAA family ATPase, partial [Cyanobacteria bacterium J06649_4]
MSTQRLQSLTIQNLRGSVETFTLEFEKGKPLTVIYGENGTGKSTICDAFEFLGHGKVGSIEGRGLGRLPGYWASLGKTSADISVELKTANEEGCCAQANNSKVVVH